MDKRSDVLDKLEGHLSHLRGAMTGRKNRATLSRTCPMWLRMQPVNVTRWTLVAMNVVSVEINGKRTHAKCNF
jgi:hypothetical protein